MEKQHKNFIDSTVKEVYENEMTIVHLITAETEDRHGDVVRSEGMDDKSYSKNPVVLYGHDQWSFPIGKSVWRKPYVKDGVKGVLAKTKFAPTEEGKLVFELWKEGFLNASSIGFIPKEGAVEPIVKENNHTGYYIRDWELLEYSIVPVPANANALRMAFEKGLGGSEKVLAPLKMHILEKQNVDFLERLDNAEKFQTEIGEKLNDVLGRLDKHDEYNIENSRSLESMIERLTTIERAIIESSQSNNEQKGAIIEVWKHLEEEITKLKKWQAEILAKEKRDETKKFIVDFLRGEISKSR